MNKTEAIRGVNVLVHGAQGPEHKLPPPTLEVIKGLTENGKTFIQLRDKSMSDRDMISLGIRIREAIPPNVPLIINDRVGVVLAMRDSGVQGVLGLHVGQKDIQGTSVRVLKEQLGEAIILGVSAGNLEQAKRAVEEGADYLGVGPLFPTANKDDADLPIGLGGLAKIRAAFTEIPIIAIGGITSENAEAVMRFGADGIAVIGAVLGSEDPQKATKDLGEIVIPQEKIPRLTPDGKFTQLDNEEEFVGRTISRREAETKGNSPVAAILLFDSEGRILLQQRSHIKSRWRLEWEHSSVETAQMDPDNPWEPEHPDRTALRGLYEELGLTNVTLPTQHYFHKYDDPSGSSSSVITYPVRYNKELHGLIVPNPQEVEKVEWVPVNEVREMITSRSRKFTPGFIQFVESYPELFQ